MNLKLDLLEDFFESEKHTIFENKNLNSYLLDFAELANMDKKGVSAETAFDYFVKDCKATLKLIENEFSSSQRLLEVGGGIGFVYIWLKKMGINLVSIEPSEMESCSYEIGKEIINSLGIDDSNWVPLMAHEVKSLNKDFDLIFSNNVIEHISNLESSFEALAAALAKNGKMKHNCPNYLVPYDPHFGIPLLPFAPKKTPFLSMAKEQFSLEYD